MLTALSVGRGGLGRFGNQCWTIAGVIGIAIKSGQPYGFPPWVNVDNANFGGTVDNLNNELKNPLPDIPEGVHFRDYGYFWGYRDLNLPTGNWSIDAHLQSTKFFEHCIDNVREVFTFKNELEKNDYVAIHYRAGDYTNGKEGHHPRCELSYYVKAMSEFTVKDRFLLFSDDRKKAEDLFDLIHKLTGINVDYAVGDDYIQDFKMMKKCKHFITANSSFSSFAAALGEHPDKIVVQPSQWFGESMPDVWRLNTKDLYHKGAIII